LQALAAFTDLVDQEKEFEYEKERVSQQCELIRKLTGADLGGLRSCPRQLDHGGREVTSGPPAHTSFHEYRESSCDPCHDLRASEPVASALCSNALENYRN